MSLNYNIKLQTFRASINKPRKVVKSVLYGFKFSKHVYHNVLYTVRKPWYDTEIGC